ncbi:MAG: type II secretion system F family protein [Vulcanisaeta sp. AZ3]
MKSLSEALSNYLSKRAIAGGYLWNIEKLSLYVEVLTYILIAMPIIMYILTRSLILTLILASIPIIPTLLIMAWAAYSVDSVRSYVEWELPFFLVLLDVVHDIGGNIVQAFEVSDRIGLKWIGREWSIISRYASTTGSITKAMQLRARVHPSPEFQRFINGYVSVWGYSGDVTAYVRDVESSYLTMLNSRLSALSKQIIDIVLAVISSIIILMLFIIVTTILGMGNALLYILPAVALMLPAIILRVYQSIPHIIRVSIRHDRRIFLILALSSIFTVLAILYLGVYGVLFLALPPTLFSILVTKEINDTRNSILSLPDLTRDVAEMVKAGIGIGAALERVLGNNYPGMLISYVRRITQFNNVEVNGPWIIKYAIGILREISNIGSPSRALDRLVQVFLDLRTLF